MWTMASISAQPLRLRGRGRAAAARSGGVRADPASFEEVYREHHQALYRYCRSILASEEDARDALQSAMTRAFAALAVEERDFELRPWLFRIAHNEAISLLRQRRTVQTVDGVPEIATDALHQRVNNRRELALLQADIGTLTERQRGALVMRELSGLSHEEIAVALTVSIGAVKQAIFEARSALQECRQGRAMDCDQICRGLSDGDGRERRARRIQAHLRECAGCREFEAGLRRRPAELAALAPPLPVAVSGALLAHLVSGGKLGLSASGAAASTTAGAGAAGGSILAGSGALGAKLAVIVVAAGAVGAVTQVAHRHHVATSAPPARIAPAGSSRPRTPSLPSARSRTPDATTVSRSVASGAATPDHSSAARSPMPRTPGHRSARGQHLTTRPSGSSRAPATPGHQTVAKHAKPVHAAPHAKHTHPVRAAPHGAKPQPARPSAPTRTPKAPEPASPKLQQPKPVSPAPPVQDSGGQTSKGPDIAPNAHPRRSL